MTLKCPEGSIKGGSGEGAGRRGREGERRNENKGREGRASKGRGEEWKIGTVRRGEGKRGKK